MLRVYTPTPPFSSIERSMSPMRIFSSFPLLSFTDYSSWNSSGYGIRRDLTVHHTTGTNYSPLPDNASRQNHATRADQNIIPNHHTFMMRTLFDNQRITSLKI